MCSRRCCNPGDRRVLWLAGEVDGGRAGHNPCSRLEWPPHSRRLKRVLATLDEPDTTVRSCGSPTALLKSCGRFDYVHAASTNNYRWHKGVTPRLVCYYT